MERIKSILIANRGEIAARIIRTAKRMGIRSVAVFSDADQYAPYLREADCAVYIGGSEPSASYLDGDKIIKTALAHGANAIHPGYGFLAENAAFAEDVAKAGLIFIGPNPKAISLMGSKSAAKSLMQKHNVPTVPGYQGEDQRVETLRSEAEKIGYPVLLKAVAGGGGKGMRIVRKSEDMSKSIDAAKREAKSSFGDDHMILERYFDSARHIEFQIFGDKHSNVRHVLERECSIQRRYQKVIEESPSPVLEEEIRAKMGEAAVNAAKALNYDNAGTVEFIYVGNGEFYFLEVNTRLQVEHPVTEMITGLDLVQMQIESAEGRKITISQKDITANGYAIECRLYAEDPANQFLPATGRLHQWSVPEMPGIRVDTGVESGSEISIYYDPMIAKIIAHGKDRSEAIRKLGYCLSNTLCSGLITNQSFLMALCNNEDFVKGNYDTSFIDQNPELCKQTESPLLPILCIAVAMKERIERAESSRALPHLPLGWRNNFYRGQKRVYNIADREYELIYKEVNGLFEIEIDNLQYIVKNIVNLDKTISMQINGVQHRLSISNQGDRYFVHHPETASISVEAMSRFPDKDKEAIKGGYMAPMPAQVIKVMVEPGNEVKSGDGLIVLSSMKMENTIYADEDGFVEDVFVNEGENIEAGVLLIKFKE